MHCRRRNALAALHPAGLTDDWSDKLHGRSFMSEGTAMAFEHYMQVHGYYL
jgi:hypothetical protein